MWYARRHRMGMEEVPLGETDVYSDSSDTRV